MAEDKNQFHSIYGDQGDEFEIEDISDETLTMPTDEIRAAWEEELAEEAAEEESEEQIADQIDSGEPEETEDMDEQEDPEEESEEEDEPEEELEEEPVEDADKVSVLSYIGHAILFTIPVIGTVAMLVYIISEGRNPHLRHLAQIWLVTLLLIAIGAVAAVTILGIG